MPSDERESGSWVNPILVRDDESSSHALNGGSTLMTTDRQGLLKWESKSHGNTEVPSIIYASSTPQPDNYPAP